MTLDLFRKPFDEGTKVKLHLFKEYLKSWFPTLLNGGYGVLNIFDFFAGSGEDQDGTAGSPLLALETIGLYSEQIKSKNNKVNLFLNEYDEDNYKELYRLVTEKAIHLNEVLEVKKTQRAFSEIFLEYLPLMKVRSTANFLFLDQSGYSQVTAQIFGEIIKLKATDSMFFVASNTIKRFGGSGRTQSYMDIPPETIWATQHKEIHRTVTEYYRGLIPKGRDYYLAPFSIKKPDTGNIYGLVFGTGHLAGLEKFLKIAWKKDSDFGEANYAVDDENIIRRQGILFSAMKKFTKKELYAEKLKNAFQRRSLKTDYELYEFTLTNGFLAKHTQEILKTLFEEKVIPKQKISLSFKGRWKGPYHPIEYD